MITDNKLIVAEIGEEFHNLSLDPRIHTKSLEFIDFVRKNSLSPGKAKQAFKEHLGKARVYRGLALDDYSGELRRITQQGVLLSRRASAEGIEKSILRAEEIGYLRGIHARLHYPGTSYEESDFVFSIAKFPEPQILPTVASKNYGKTSYLFEFDMPAFDLLGITIADITADEEEKPYLFSHKGAIFNGSDPDVEIFVLHKTHMSNLQTRRFEKKEDVFEFCRPYRRKMEQLYPRFKAVRLLP